MIQADPNKYYHVFSAGKFPFFDFENGKYSEFEVKPEAVQSVSKNYDATIHKAPVWIGHPSLGAEARAWIAKSDYENGKLFNSFDWIDEELIESIKNKRYQYVSCEFGRVMGVEGDYQIALGITNLPRVSKLKPLDLEGQGFDTKKGNVMLSPITDSFSIDFVKDFSASTKKYFFNNNNKTSMNELIKKLAVLFSIDTAKFSTDEAVVSQITENFSSLSDAKTKAESENKVLKDERVKFALDQAISEGRIKPADKDSYESLLQGNYEATRKVMFSLPVDPALKKNEVPPGGSGIEDPGKGKTDKFSNEDGTKLTFDQFSENVKKDPAYAKNFSDEEIAGLPGADQFYMS